MAVIGVVVVEWRVVADHVAWGIRAGEVLELRWGHSLVARDVRGGVTRLLPLNYGGLMGLWDAGIVADPVRVRLRPQADRPARARRVPRRL